MDIGQIIQSFLNTPDTLFGTNVLGPLEPLLVQFLRTTPEDWTTGNLVVYGAWDTMLAVTNAFFIFFLLTGVIQIMISQSTGTLSIPLELYYAIIILLNIGLIRLLLQAFERLVLWNLLFVLSPIAFLCTFLPMSASVFAFWGRMSVVVTFTQFLQFLAFALGIALFTSAGNSGSPLVQLLMAVAMLYLVAKIPTLIGRFPGMGVNASQGVGQVISSVMLFVRLIAA
jgi:hypothetical protein